MSRIPGMPLLPGTLFREISKTYYPKPQSLMNAKGVSMLSDRQQPALVDPHGNVVDLNCPSMENPSIYPPRSGPRLPPWVVFDKKVLCFNAYFKQTLQEVFHAPYQVRKVKICFFLEDGTVQITEPKIENSGMVQGVLLHRQRAPRPPPCENEFMSMLDFNVDTTVQIFDRCYHITNCDKFTRNFLNTHGITVPDPIVDPDDPLTAVSQRKLAREYSQPEKKHPLAQFLKYDRQVLKFQAYWDDLTEFGDVRKLEICYYLGDDTVEIKEHLPRNSGRDGPSLFFKRRRLPREFVGLPLLGEETSITLLNVLGSKPRNMRYIVDPLNTGSRTVRYYSDRDFQIGSVINVYGRSVVITDADTFTRDFYRKKYGIDDFRPLAMPTRSDEFGLCSAKERVMPPYNGWGSYEDSMGNCISVEAKPPMVDFKKFIKYDRYVLRFGAKQLSTIKENCERIFVISYYLADDTIQIYELAVPNSGFVGGEFMKRTRMLLPGQEKFSSKLPLYYQPYNFYVGATMDLKAFIFHIVSADEYTLIFMEHHPDRFPFANVKLIMDKVRKALKGRVREFIGRCVPESSDVMTTPNIFLGYESIKASIIALLGNEISDHEIITLCRYYSAEQKPTDKCQRDTVRSAALLEIKRALWNGREDLIEHFHHINPTYQPFMAESKIRSTIRGCRLPFSAPLLDNIMQVLNRNDCNEIEICDFMNFIDMSCGKVCDIPPKNSFELCPKVPFLTRGRSINFSCFLKDLGLKPEEDPPKKMLPNY